jgi:hypothetical protein
VQVRQHNRKAPPIEPLFNRARIRQAGRIGLTPIKDGGGGCRPNRYLSSLARGKRPSQNNN